MQELKAMCLQSGFQNARTYIASGNVIFESELPASAVKVALEARLDDYAGKPVGVILRTAAEMAAALAASPFPDARPERTTAIFLNEPPLPASLEAVSGRKNEAIRPGLREIYVHYPDGMGSSRLKIPAAAVGTARNMNTVAKLVELSSELREHLSSQ
jgi:uncharacterized protein (DUF1697 family)